MLPFSFFANDHKHPFDLGGVGRIEQRDVYLPDYERAARLITGD